MMTTAIPVEYSFQSKGSLFLDPSLYDMVPLAKVDRERFIRAGRDL